MTKTKRAVIVVIFLVALIKSTDALTDTALHVSVDISHNLVSIAGKDERNGGKEPFFLFRKKERSKEKPPGGGSRIIRVLGYPTGCARSFNTIQLMDGIKMQKNLVPYEIDEIAADTVPCFLVDENTLPMDLGKYAADDAAANTSLRLSMDGTIVMTGQQHLLFLSDSSQQIPIRLRDSPEKDDGKTSNNE